MADLDDFAVKLKYPRQREFFEYWRAKAPPGKLPGRQHFDPLDIPALLPWIVMYDVVRQGGDPRFRFRLVGTGIVEQYGRDATGMWFEDAYEGEILERQMATFTEVATSGRPHLSRPTLPIATKEYITYERLILPLAGDGVNVDRLIALMVFDAKGP